jgi:hypothetical protein
MGGRHGETSDASSGENARSRLAAGRFQGFANIERELIAFGNENEIALIVGPVRNTVERDCVSERAREIAAWHTQTAC